MNMTISINGSDTPLPADPRGGLLDQLGGFDHV
jgi:hypothetical protein